MIKLCEVCDSEFEAYTRRQRFCKTHNVRDSATKRRIRYGVTQSQYEQLVLYRNGKCHLCDDRGCEIDHDHETGRVRGLLCGGCNVKLAAFNDPSWSQAAIKYLDATYDAPRFVQVTSLVVGFHACKKCGNLMERVKGWQRTYCIACVPDRPAKTRMVKYGISELEYQGMLVRQKFKCVLCEEFARSIDHCHETGVVRGILCQGCNIKLPGLEDKEWRARAMSYLQG